MKTVPYVSAVGSLMYAIVCMRLDIAHAVGVMSRFFANLKKEHWGRSKVDYKVSQRDVDGQFVFRYRIT